MGGLKLRCGLVSSCISGRGTACLSEAAQQHPTSCWSPALAPNAQLAVTGTACQQSHTLPHRRAGVFRGIVEARVAAQRLTGVQGGGAVHAACHLWMPEGGGKRAVRASNGQAGATGVEAIIVSARRATLRVGATSGRWQQPPCLASGAAAVAVRAESAGAGRALAISTLVLRSHGATCTSQLHAGTLAWGCGPVLSFPLMSANVIGRSTCSAALVECCHSTVRMVHTHAVVWACRAVARGIHGEAKVAGLHGECAAFLEAHEQRSQGCGDQHSTCGLASLHQQLLASLGQPSQLHTALARIVRTWQVSPLGHSEQFSRPTAASEQGQGCEQVILRAALCWRAGLGDVFSSASITLVANKYQTAQGSPTDSPSQSTQVWLSFRNRPYRLRGIQRGAGGREVLATCGTACCATDEGMPFHSY